MRVMHKNKPSEPWASKGQFGEVLRITPAYRTIPAQAYCRWDDYYTWEKLTDLEQLAVDD